jgi:hypothetical protein
MKHKVLLLLGLIGCVGCQKPEKEDGDSARSADFEKMVIIQDQNAGNTIGGENEQELKVR